MIGLVNLEGLRPVWGVYGAGLSEQWQGEKGQNWWSFLLDCLFDYGNIRLDMNDIKDTEVIRKELDAIEGVFLTTSEIARLLKTSRRTVSRWCDTAEMPAYQVGREWRIDKNEFIGWLTDLKNYKKLANDDYG